MESSSFFYLGANENKWYTMGEIPGGGVKLWPFDSPLIALRWPPVDCWYACLYFRRLSSALAGPQQIHAFSTRIMRAQCLNRPQEEGGGRHSRPVGGRSCFQWQLYRSREDSNRQWENQICTNKQPQIVHSDTIVFQICNIYTKHCDSKHIMVRWKRHKMGQFKQHRLYNMILLVLWRVFPFLFDKLQWILKHNQSSLENHQPRLCDSRALNPCPPLEFQMWCLC